LTSNASNDISKKLLEVVLIESSQSLLSSSEVSIVNDIFQRSNATVTLQDGWVTGGDDLWAVNSSGIITLGKETYIISVYTQEQQTLEDGEKITSKVCSTVASLLAS
jgi:hypothetical protein